MVIIAFRAWHWAGPVRSYVTSVTMRSIYSPNHILFEFDAFLVVSRHNQKANILFRINQMLSKGNWIRTKKYPWAKEGVLKTVWRATIWSEGKMKPKNADRNIGWVTIPWDGSLRFRIHERRFFSHKTIGEHGRNMIGLIPKFWSERAHGVRMIHQTI